jgi:hypothetical protein
MEIHFFKNVAMAGGFAYVAAFGGGAYSFDAPIGRRRGRVRAIGRPVGMERHLARRLRRF